MDRGAGVIERITHDEVETVALAARLAVQLRPGDCVALRGDLGAGKTAFARGIIQSLTDAGIEVASPTFTLVQTYDIPAQTGPYTLWHVDLYRLEDITEAEALGLEDAWNDSVVLVEWPDLIDSLLPADRLEIQLAHGTEENDRILRFSAKGNWNERLKMVTMDV